MTAAETCFALLQEAGADSVFHHGRTLLQHLSGTFAILEKWQTPDHVQVAGLCHSIYGWLAEPTPASRKVFADVIGQPAEELVYLYSAVPPDCLLEPIIQEKTLKETISLKTSAGERIECAREMYLEILLLDLANCADIAVNDTVSGLHAALLSRHVMAILAVENEAIQKTADTFYPLGQEFHLCQRD